MMERYYFSSLIFAALVATAICDNPTENDSRLNGGEVAGVVFVGLFVYGFVMGIVYLTFLQSKSPDIEEEMQVDDEEMVLAKKTSTEEAPTDQKIPEEKADEPAPVKVEKKARPISTAIVQEAVEDMRMQLQERQDSDMNFYLSGFEDEATGDAVEEIDYGNELPEGNEEEEEEAEEADGDEEKEEDMEQEEEEEGGNPTEDVTEQEEEATPATAEEEIAPAPTTEAAADPQEEVTEEQEEEPTTATEVETPVEEESPAEETEEAVKTPDVAEGTEEVEETEVGQDVEETSEKEEEAQETS